MLPLISSLLEIKSNNRGLLIPRINLVSETDVVTIANPATSLLIYNTNAAVTDGEGYYFWNGTKWSKLATRSNLANLAWGTTGNTGTNAATDFIGTIDDMPLVFKTNNIESGRIDANASNVFFGRNAGEFTTGINNSFFGHLSGHTNTSGVQNTALGAFSLEFNSNGDNNTALGLSALRYNNTGNENIAVGAQALFANITGSRNVGIGRQSLQSGIDAADCIAIGNDALSSLTTGTGAIAIGSGALQNATNGYRTMGIGFNTLFDNYGDHNIAVGYEALKANSSGDYNTGIGDAALFGNTSGDYNTAAGMDALYHNTNGYRNTALGTDALYFNVSGFENTAIGMGALREILNGDKNTAVGYYSGPAAWTLSLNNTSAIGYSAQVTTDNTMVFGNADVDRWAFGITTTIANHALEVGNSFGNGNGAYLTQGGTWTNTSSKIKKEDFSDINGLELLQKIQLMPVQKWKYKGTNEYHIGPVAEDFYKLFGLGIDDKGISTVDPAGIALAAIQEQQRIIEKQNELIIQLQKRMEALEKK